MSIEYYLVRIWHTNQLDLYFIFIYNAQILQEKIMNPLQIKQLLYELLGTAGAWTTDEGIQAATMIVTDCMIRR